MSTTSSNRNPVEALAEEFLRRKRRGEPVTPEDYAEGHPDLAEEILALFPAPLMMEDLGGDSVEHTGSVLTGVGAIGGTAAGRLGEFRLLREVGRGGMGVVYEAEQESLGRRVAPRSYLTTLGVAQYRLGLFREASATLAQAGQVEPNAQEPLPPRRSWPSWPWPAIARGSRPRRWRPWTDCGIRSRDRTGPRMVNLKLSGAKPRSSSRTWHSRSTRSDRNGVAVRPRDAPLPTPK
jgi:hypothetical protein